MAGGAGGPAAAPGHAMAETLPASDPRSLRGRRDILHVDMDAFFAAIEVLDQPALAGKPIIVGGTPEQRGVVATASYEARRYGIHSAMSSWKARQLCPHAIFLPPRRRRYVECSRQVFAIFGDYTPLVEQVSIDEAFLDVTGNRRLFGAPETIAREIKRRIRQEVGLTASVGIAPNKFLAKLASDMEKPDGLVVVAPERIDAFLLGLPVGKLWGVGEKTRRRLSELGIRTVADLRNYPVELLEQHFGTQGLAMRELAFGRDDRPVVAASEAKSIGSETTFARDIAEPARLRAILDELAEKVARRLRREGLRARTVHLKARYADFTTVTRSETIETATARSGAIRDLARRLFDQRLGRPSLPMRLLGVSVSNLEPAGAGQIDLFPDPREQKDEALDHLLDRIGEKYEKTAIQRGLTHAAADDDD